MAAALKWSAREHQSLQPMRSMCYKRIMREWVREKLMRRRKKPVTNDSESTGKIGHEIPQDQPTPLQPSYPQSLEHEGTPQTAARVHHPVEVSGGEENAPAQAVASSETRLADDSSREQRTRQGRGGSRGSGNRGTGNRSSGNRNSGNRTGNRSGNRNENRSDDNAKSVPPTTSGSGEQTVVHEMQPESLEHPSTAPEAGKSPKGYVVLTIGLPGSGKTTWFKRRGVTPLSSDMLRNILFDDITEQRYQGLVFSTLRSLLRARLIAKMQWNYVDATNLSPHERRQWIKMARSFGYEVHAVFFDVPYEVCVERNARRDRTVDEEAMAKMQERLRPPSFKEGFHKITVVRVKSNAVEVPDDFSSQA